MKNKGEFFRIVTGNQEIRRDEEEK